ncbi:MAG: hypothetical protein COA33_013015 [Fluviicola sp.]|nr:hypothetical protein [Fluviicola sp.]
MFAPLGGPKLGLSFFETYFSIVAGGIVAGAIFYFSAEFFILRSIRKNKEKIAKLKAQGKPFKQKKKFSRMNKFILKIKGTFGQFGIAMWAPFFLSVPIGSIVAAKFYGKSKKTYPLMVLGMFVNGFITTSITYAFV